MKQFFKILFMLLAVCLAFFLCLEAATDLPVVAQDVTETPYPEGGGRIAEKYFAAKQVNKDVVAYLVVQGVSDEPVLYRDNDYYLFHDYTEEYTKYGGLFVNEFFKPDFHEQSVLIHGHNFPGSHMAFSDMLRFKTQSFAEKDRIIQLFDGEYLRYYRVYTVFGLNDGEEYIQQGAKAEDGARDSAANKAYMQSLHARSMVRLAEPDYDANTLYFSTCDHSLPQKNPRLIVGVYQVKSYRYTAAETTVAATKAKAVQP